METIENRMRKLVTDHLDVKPEQVTREAKFEDLGADSLDMVELAIGMEEEFDIEIPDEEGEKMLTFGQAVDYVRAALPDSADA